MKNTLTHPALVVLAFLSSLSPQFSPAFAQGTAFTYQGRVNDGGSPASGSYDFRFALFDASSDGTPQGNTLTNAATAVSNGLFTVTLDFGNQFPGANRWVEIGVRSNGGSAFITLSPRQKLTPTPYAIYAPNAGVAASANTVATDAVATGGLQNNAVTGAKILDGSVGAVDVNATLFSNTFWKVDGNAGTTPGPHFIGTTDSQAVEVRAGNLRMFRLEPAGLQANILGGPGVAGLPSGVVGVVLLGTDFTQLNGTESPHTVIAGGQANTIRSNASQGVISGGWGNRVSTNSYRSSIGGGGGNMVSQNSAYSVIAGGDGNNVGGNAVYAAIGGGSGNTNRADGGTIPGGWRNQIGTGATYSFVGGGAENLISSNSTHATIAGGLENKIGLAAYQSAIGGGWLNSVGDGSDSSTIGGGRQNHAQEDYATIAGGIGNTNIAVRGSIGGGFNNTIMAVSSVISGGSQNRILPNAVAAAIGGGESNAIFTNAYYATIAGGHSNQIGENTVATSVGGGEHNAVANGAQWATIPGGYSNRVGGLYSFAAGRQAKALHSGAFVWADSQNADFVSSTANQFLIRAVNGVGINTNNPQSMLHVGGTVTANGFNGGGAGLSGLNASQLTAGVVPSSALSGTYSSALTFNNAANNITGNGAGLTELNASSLASGTVADARLSSNVARRDATQTFTGDNTFLGTVGIGTSAPATGLTVATGIGFGIEHTDGTRRLSTYLDSAGCWLGSVSAHPLFFYVNNGVSSMTVDLSGRIGIGTPSPTNKLHVIGGATFSSGAGGANQSVVWTPGSGSWSFTSDRNTKDRVAPVNSQSVLEKVARLPISEWSYVGYDQRHIGPMAQDFHAQFPLNGDDKSLNDADLHGVALAAIQGLNQKLETELKSKNARVAELEQRLERLEKLVSKSVAVR